jgi:hypothetical protein
MLLTPLSIWNESETSFGSLWCQVAVEYDSSAMDGWNNNHLVRTSPEGGGLVFLDLPRSLRLKLFGRYLVTNADFIRVEVIQF